MSWPHSNTRRRATLRLTYRHLSAAGARGHNPSSNMTSTTGPVAQRPADPAEPAQVAPTKLLLPKTDDNTLNIYARTENAGVTETGRVAIPSLPLHAPATEAIRQQYIEQGWAVLPRALSPTRIETCRAALEQQYALEGDRGGIELGETIVDPSNPGVRRLCNLFWKHRAFLELATEPAVLDFARLTIGRVVKWQAMNAHDPVPGDSRAAQPLHADRMFFASCEGYFNAVVALDDFTVECGATRVVPFSHKQPWPQGITLPSFSVDGERRVTCQAGDIVIIHGDLWHSGMPNLAGAGTTRRGIHLGFACENTRPQYSISEQFPDGSEARAEIAELLPLPLATFPPKTL